MASNTGRDTTKIGVGEEAVGVSATTSSSMQIPPLKSPSCELLPAAEIVLDQALKRYTDILQTLPALGARAVQQELTEMKKAREHVEASEKWRDICANMCLTGKKDELKKK